MLKFTATKAMSFRAARFRIPSAAFGFEFTEFTGGPRKPVRPNIQDIGAATVGLVAVRTVALMICAGILPAALSQEAQPAGGRLKGGYLATRP
jgi:hypothetical protein